MLQRCCSTLPATIPCNFGLGIPPRQGGHDEEELLLRIAASSKTSSITDTLRKESSRFSFPFEREREREDGGASVSLHESRFHSLSLQIVRTLPSINANTSIRTDKRIRIKKIRGKGKKLLFFPNKIEMLSCPEERGGKKLGHVFEGGRFAGFRGGRRWEGAGPVVKSYKMIR